MPVLSPEARQVVDEVGSQALEHLALVLTGEPPSLSQQDEAGLGETLTDLANRIETTVGVLRELIELVNPQGLLKDLHVTTSAMEIFGLLSASRSRQ